MVTLRCTQRLLRRLGTATGATTSPPTTVLGDWYANLYHTRPQQIVLCVSERTMLAVIVPARDAKSLGSRFRARVLDLLMRLGVPASAIHMEAQAMADVAVGPTASRKVLGCMNEAAYTISTELELGRRTTSMALELFLSENIYSLTGYRHPRDLALELFSVGGRR